MEVLKDATALRSWRARMAAAGKRVAFVPTMGALHDGHLSLIRTARAAADVVIASIYVNPTQFDRAEDLANYPRDPEGDHVLLQRVGCGALFEPAALYGAHHGTWVEVPELAAHLCGATRPGHFRGVATIVLKLLNLVSPAVAVFGNKDFQQVSVIRRMVEDLDLDVNIIAAPTIREADGLAMSSRNRRLDPANRAAAVAIPRALEAARAAWGGGQTTAGPLVAAVHGAIEAAGGRIDYVSAVHPENLVPLAHDAVLRADSVIAVAAFFGPVRLIDNCAVGG
jgi:pantoate--beta-alanine ligase